MDSMKKIGIIGANKAMCSQEMYDFAEQLGKSMATKDRSFICGGLGGIMESVCKGVKQSPNTYKGQTVGILPSNNVKDANPYIDVAIPTGAGFERNIEIVQRADILIAIGGGAGTLSEIAFAWQLKKTVLCVTLYNGWAKELAGRDLDNRQSGLLITLNSIDEI